MECRLFRRKPPDQGGGHAGLDRQAGAVKGRAGLPEPSPMHLLAIPYPVIDPVAIVSCR